MVVRRWCAIISGFFVASFGAVAEPSERIDRSVEATIHRNSDRVTVSLTSTHFQPLELVLTPSSLPSDAIHIHRSANGSRLAVGPLARSTCAFSHMGADVQLAVDDCSGDVRGVLHLGTETYLISSLEEEQRLLNVLENHVRRRKREADVEESKYCNVDDPPLSDDPPDARVPTSRLAGLGQLVVEMAIFVDDVLYRKFGGFYGWSEAESKLEQYVVAVFNNIQILYHHPSLGEKIKFKIVRYELFKSPHEDINAYFSDTAMLLDQFCGLSAVLSDREWDHAFLFTGADLKQFGSDSISGIAKLGGMCRPWSSCTIAEGFDFNSAFIGAHEIGHSFGLTHDDLDCGSGFIMSGKLGAAKTTWSSCSQRQLQKALSRIERSSANCLTKSAGTPETLVLDISELPGQVFSGTRQCQLMHGKDYSQVGTYYGDRVCRMMWCKRYQQGHLITSHPALEGTFCDKDKWCIGGKCVPWNGDLKVDGFVGTVAPPRRIDGGWGSFSDFGCSSCPPCAPFVDGIPLVKSRRECDNPSPRNGGSFCSGSPVRGAICPDQGCTTGYHGEMQGYMDNICRTHKDNLGDGSLTGVATQLRGNLDRACKVFCDVVSSSRRTYRHFGDVLPDGSNCGYRKYCVFGRCLSVECSDFALVATTDHCPPKTCNARFRSPQVQAQARVADPDAFDMDIEEANPPPRRAVTPSRTGPRWTSWGLWSSCSATCGEGIRSRTRSCYGGSGTCGGERREERACSGPTCVRPVYNAWQSWTSCTVTCGRGTRTRRRTCRGSFCDGANFEREDCLPGDCPFSEWSACTLTCGGGTQRRIKQCPGGSCRGGHSSLMEVRGCNSQVCGPAPTPAPNARLGVWGSWTSCSTTCGPGQRYRNRACDGTECHRHVLKEIEICSEQRCLLAEPSASTDFEFTDWSVWSRCSRTCGPGRKTRSRGCSSGYCVGERKQATTCDEAACPGPKTVSPDSAVWSAWTRWADCSATCGFATQSRRRSCYSISREICEGLPSESRRCDTVPKCPAKASVTFTAYDDPGSPAEPAGSRDPPLTDDPHYNQYTEWSIWSPCTKECDGGIKTRARACAYDGMCEERKQVERRDCNVHVCYS